MKFISSYHDNRIWKTKAASIPWLGGFTPALDDCQPLSSNEPIWVEPLARDHAWRRRESDQEVDKAQAQPGLVSEGVIRKLPGGYFVCVWYIEYRNVRLLMTKHTIAGKGISLQVWRYVRVLDAIEICNYRSQRGFVLCSSYIYSISFGGEGQSQARPQRGVVAKTK